MINLIVQKFKAKKKLKCGLNRDIDKYKELRHSVKRLLAKCHDDYIKNTEEKLKTNSKCFFSYTESMKKTNSLPINLRLKDDRLNDKSCACDWFARFCKSVYQESDCISDIFDDCSFTNAQLRNIAITDDEIVK